MSDLSFGVHVVPRGPEHGRDLLLRMEDTEFDTVWLMDGAGRQLDPWVTLGAMAIETEEVELGMLVTDMGRRDPGQLTRFAMTVDQLSSGRFILGLSGQQAAEQPGFGEQVHDVDRLLRETGESFQQPRPPLLIAGNDLPTIETAVAHGDTWNAWIDQPDSDLAYQVTAECVAMLATSLDTAQRNASSLARSLLLLPGAADPWDDDSTIPRLVEQYRTLGFTEFIFSPPRMDQMRDFLRIGIGVLSTLRD